MSDWKEILGTFTGLDAPVVSKAIMQSVFKHVLARRAEIVKNSQNCNPDYVDPYGETFLNLEETVKLEDHDKKKAKPVVPTYKYEEKIFETDDKGKKTTVVKESKIVEKPKKKWCTFNAEAKNAFDFMLKKFLREYLDFLKARKYEFTPVEDLASTLINHTINSDIYIPGMIPNIAPFILAYTSEFNDNNYATGSYGDVETIIYTKTGTDFNNVENQKPEAQLRFLIARWAQFVKIMSCKMGVLLFSQKKRIELWLVETMLRTMSADMSANEQKINEGIIQLMQKYVADCETLAKQDRDRRAAERANKPAKSADSEPAKTPIRETAFDDIINGIGDDDDFGEEFTAGNDDGFDWVDGVGDD